MKQISLLFVLMLLFSCTQEKTAAVNDQKPYGQKSSDTPASAVTASADKGGYSLELAPADATTGTTLFLRPKGFGLSEAKIEWLVNGFPVEGANTNTFSAGKTRKGDTVRARVRIKEREILSNETIIKNSPPQITRARFLPAGNTLSADVDVYDADGDSVSVKYEWTVNGKPSATGKGLDVPLKKGDKISLKITASDGESEGRPAFLVSQVHNLPPVFSKHSDYSYEGGVYTYYVKATDPDGNPVACSLKSCPPGMTIDPKTGLVTWNVPPDFHGKASFTVSAADDRGGVTTQTFTVDLP